VSMVIFFIAVLQMAKSALLNNNTIKNTRQTVGSQSPEICPALVD